MEVVQQMWPKQPFSHIEEILSVLLHSRSFFLSASLSTAAPPEQGQRCKHSLLRDTKSERETEHEDSDQD